MVNFGFSEEHNLDDSLLDDKDIVFAVATMKDKNNQELTVDQQILKAKIEDNWIGFNFHKVDLWMKNKP